MCNLVQQISKILFLLFWLFSASLSAKSVGLVMSGGGAKGLAHIGVIKALEEHNIPIDYVAGTSIGAIIGGLYAMGYTPDEMADIIRSDEFQFWLTGDIEPKYQYYFKTAETLPNYLRIGVDIKDSLQISPRLPSSLIPPVQMNYVFLKLFAQANALSSNSFDNLFVPFRCVASNVNEKKAHIFRSGDLGNAVRASMSFPLVFKPITIDGNLMLDGGIYNNFPTNVMQRAFNPDYMIGSNVASDPKEINENNVYTMLESMVVNRFEYPIPSGKGTTIKFQLNDVSLLDFDKLDKVMKIGYDQTIAIIDEIKQSVQREVTLEELATRRAAFKKKLPELRFNEICLEESTELDEAQKEYISRTMNKNGHTFDLTEFKKDYFKLLADKQIDRIVPSAIYAPTDSLFELSLNVFPRERLSVLFGGNISTGVANQTYIGLNYKGFSSYTYDLLVDGQFGRIYNAGRLIYRIDLPTQNPLYLKMTGNIHTFNHFASNMIFYEDNRQVSQYQRESYVKFNIGIPIKMSSLLELGLTGGRLTDTYRREGFDYSDGKSDISSYDITGLSLRYESNSLDDRQFPATGSCHRYLAQQLWSKDNYETSVSGLSNQTQYDNWLQLSVYQESYFRINKNLSLGLLGEAVYSNRKLLPNYTATLLQMPAFTPTVHSKTTFNKAFRANQYVAAGMQPVWFIYKQLQLRGGLYGFMPLQSIEQTDEQTMSVHSLDKNFELKLPDYSAELAFVLRIKSLSLSVFGNYYSAPEGNFNIGLNFGFLLFNKKLIEK